MLKPAPSASKLPQLLSIVSNCSRDKTETTDGDDGGGWMRSIKRKNTGDGPASPPSITSIHHPLQQGMECEICVCVSVCVGSKRTCGGCWRPPSSPRLCHPRRLWAAGAQSPQTRNRRPGRRCWGARRGVSPRSGHFRSKVNLGRCSIHKQPKPY